ncbi:MAG: hypothetical protein ACJ795_13675 [Ktedonobacteraceae bacterium]
MTRKFYHRPPPFTKRSRNTWQGLVSPEGTAYRRIPDLHNFCIAHKLNHDAVYKLVQWEVDDVEGWSRAG